MTIERTKESIARISRINFGEQITNICASTNNPRKYSFFVELKVSSSKNRFGVTYTERHVKSTDGKGKFWLTDIDVIYPGILSEEECVELFNPIHRERYPMSYDENGRLKEVCEE